MYTDQQTKIKSIITKLCKYSFKTFLIKAFHTVSPNVNFQDNWHIALLCHIWSRCKARKLSDS